MEIKEKLLSKNFKESFTKPNLYLYNFGYVTLFIDLRTGKNERCLFYQILDKNNNLSNEVKERLNLDIIKQYFLMNKFCKENFNFKLRFIELYGLYDSGFRYECPICKSAILKDFGIVFEHTDNYSYENTEFVCSVRCLESLKIKRKFELKEALKEEQEAKIQRIMRIIKEREDFQCQACKKIPIILFDEEGYPYYTIDRVKHHIDYSLENEKMIWVCPSCHAKITWYLDKHPELKQYEPKGTRKEYLKKKNEEKMKRVKEREIKRETKKKTTIQQNKDYRKYSNNLRKMSKDWYKRA